MQTYAFDTSAAAIIPAAGNFFCYVSGSAAGNDDAIIVRPDSGGMPIELQPGQQFRFPRAVGAWRIAPRTAGAVVVGKVLVGDGDFADNRVSGSVEVIDGGKSRTLSGRSFAMSDQAGPVVGQISAIQLWNPAAGKIAVVRSFNAVISVAGGILIQPNYAPITISLAQPNNKRANGAASVMQARAQSAVAAPGSRIGSPMFYPIMAPNVPVYFALADPIILEPGYGLLMYSAATNVQIWGGFEFHEEDFV